MTGNRDDRDDGAGKVPQEDHDHQAHDEEFFDQRVPQVVDGVVDQFGSIVSGDYLQALGQRRFNICQLGLYALDCLLGVLAETHDHHSADGLAPSIELNYAAPDLGTVDHRCNVTHQHGRAGLRVVHDDDVLNVLQRLDVAASSHHVLAAGHLHQPRADIVVSLLNGV